MSKNKMKQGTIFGIILGFLGLPWVAVYLDKRRIKEKCEIN